MPPSNRSALVPALMRVSFPAPPRRELALDPLPPSIQSLPPPPKRKSLPVPPTIVRLNPKASAWMELVPFPPKTDSIPTASAFSPKVTESFNPERFKTSNCVTELTRAAVIPLSVSSLKITAAENPIVSSPESPASVDLSALKSAAEVKSLLAMTLFVIRYLLQKTNRQFYEGA